MRLIGRILAIVLVLMIPLLLMAASCNLALYTTMSNEQTYRDAFADRSLLNDITPLAVPALFNASSEALASYAGSLSMDRIIDTIGFENWSRIMADVVPASWMQARFDQILRLFTGILKNDYATLDESVDVESIQARLQGDSGQSIASKIMSFTPACTTEQEAQIQVFQSDLSGELPLCIASDEALQAFSVSHLTGWLNGVGNQLVSANKFFDLTTTEARGLHVILKLDEQSSYVLYLCPAALLALIVFFTVRSFRSFGRWVGGTLLLSGIGVLVALVVIQFFLVNLLSAAAGSRTMNDSERLFSQIMVSLVRSGMGGISQSMLLQAGLMILAGFGLFGLTSLLARNELISTGTTVLVTDDGRVISSTSLPTVPVEPSSTARQSRLEQRK